MKKMLTTLYCFNFRMLEIKGYYFLRECPINLNIKLLYPLTVQGFVGIGK